MKRLISLIAGTVLAIGLAKVPAEAATITLSPSPTASASFTEFESHTGGNPFSLTNFTDAVTFTLTKASDVTLDLFSIGVSKLAFSLTPPPPGSTPVPGFIFISGGDFSLGLLAAGDYTLNLAGKVSLFGGVVLGKITAVAATPIPPALLMFITGLAGLGAVGWRRRQTLAA